MSWIINTLTSTIGRKVIMALTGLFLILFLTVHLVGNLQLLKNDGGESFNLYTQFMAHNPLIQAVSKGNFFFIFLHVFVSLTLYVRNKKARPIGYKVSSGNSNSSWSSRSMALLGTFILIFIFLHLYGYWFQLKYVGEPIVQMISIDGVSMHNAYALVAESFQIPGVVAFYVIAMIVLGFHLWHGFASAFQSLGLNHPKYNGIISGLGKLYAVIIPVLFMLIPIYMYLNNAG
ncbi:MAG: succinate dehydrogenase cytochrome b subunit [Cyclobacteriaceae bacterium]|nr:succinate dehydrogenase cytochrome b subunit [Cyclobacteriaceae bacterium]